MFHNRQTDDLTLIQSLPSCLLCTSLPRAIELLRNLIGCMSCPVRILPDYPPHLLCALLCRSSHAPTPHLTHNTDGSCINRAAPLPPMWFYAPHVGAHTTQLRTLKLTVFTTGALLTQICSLRSTYCLHVLQTHLLRHHECGSLLSVLIYSTAIHSLHAGIHPAHHCNSLIDPAILCLYVYTYCMHSLYREPSTTYFNFVSHYATSHLVCLAPLVFIAI